MKRISTLLIIIAMIFSLSACGVNQNNPSPAPENNNSTITESKDENDSKSSNTNESEDNISSNDFTDNSTETPTTSSTNKIELNERLCCPDCWYGLGELADTDELYKTYDKLVCRFCGKVEDEDYKGIYILPE